MWVLDTRLDTRLDSSGLMTWHQAAPPADERLPAKPTTTRSRQTAASSPTRWEGRKNSSWRLCGRNACPCLCCVAGLHRELKMCQCCHLHKTLLKTHPAAYVATVEKMLVQFFFCCVVKVLWDKSVCVCVRERDRERELPISFEEKEAYKYTKSHALRRPVMPCPVCLYM